MAAPTTTVWGNIQKHDRTDKNWQAKIGINITTTNTNSTTTATVQVWFWSNWAATDDADNHTLYLNDNSTSATTKVASVDIATKNNQTEWSEDNQVLLCTKTYTHNRTSTEQTLNVASKLSTIEYVGNKDLTATATYIVPALDTYKFNIRGLLEGVHMDGLGNLGTVDIYINGAKVGEGVSSYEAFLPYGTTYAVKNIKTIEGHHCVGFPSGGYSGTITQNSSVIIEIHKHKVYVVYNSNGGTLTGSDTRYSINYIGFIAKNENVNFHIYNYGEKGDLYNAESFGLVREGYKFVGWQLKSTGVVLDQDIDYDSTVYVGYNNPNETTANTAYVTCHVYAVWEPIQSCQYIKENGEYKIGAMSIKVKGLWKPARRVYRKINGVWKSKDPE